MTLEIDPNTEKGRTQIETIGWCQEQINKVMELFFNGNYRIQKGLRVDFKIPLNGQFNESVKIDISELAPNTKEALDNAITHVRKVMVFTPQPPQFKDVKLKKSSLPNATDFPIDKKGEKDGTDKK